jgi:hypothetical protein
MVDSYTQWSSVLAKLCLQTQKMCHKYCIRSQTAVNLEKYFYTFTFCIRTRSKWLNFVILRQPTLPWPLMTETHWTGRGSLCGWRIWWSRYNITDFFQVMHNLLHDCTGIPFSDMHHAATVPFLCTPLTVQYSLQYFIAVKHIFVNHRYSWQATVLWTAKPFISK